MLGWNHPYRELKSLLEERHSKCKGTGARLVQEMMNLIRIVAGLLLLSYKAWKKHLERLLVLRIRMSLILFLDLPITIFRTLGNLFNLS